MRIKLSRGPEEIQALRLSNRIAELGIKASVETAAPGVPQRDVWFAIAKAYLDASGGTTRKDYYSCRCRGKYRKWKTTKRGLFNQDKF